MSGSRLCAVLGELGFDGQDALDPDSFEWPFQYEEARPVLDWICSSLRPSNVLSLPELSQYEHFLHEGKLLEGEDLDSAFDSISAFSSKKDNQEAVFGAEERLMDIREAKLAFKAEVVELQKQLERQQSMFDLLASQASALIQGRRARVSATSSVNTQLISLDEKFSARNLEMNSVLGKMASTAQELAHYHSGDEGGIYLAYSNFHPYLVEDLACTRELNQWFSKQFHKGPLRLVAEEGKSKCSWVSLDDLTNCLIRGDHQKPHHHHHNRVAELQRLRSIFATSERQWVEAQVENAKQQAILTMLKSQISSDEAHIHRDINFLRKKHSELAGEFSNLSHKEQKFLSEVIPGLCSDLAQLQDTYILQGDYDLKVMRQEYYINRQKMFINHLVNQLARHRFLKIACQMERRTILGAYSLVKVIESELEGYLSAGNGRLGHSLSLIDAAMEVQEESVGKADLFDCLHDDIVIEILSFVSGSAERPSDLLSVMKTCKRMNRLGKSPLVLKKAALESISIRAENWSQPAQNFLEMCVDAGNLEACYLVGMIEFYCLGISRGGSDGVMSRRKGLRYLIRATRRGHAPATYSLAVICFNGSAARKCDRHVRMGVALCIRAAQLGHVDAIRELGHCYLDGYGVPKNVTKGSQLLFDANSREFPAALNNPSDQSVSASNEQSCHLHKVACDCSFFSDFEGILPTPEPHPANRFMAEWFERTRDFGQRVRVCANSYCCRPEIRRFEFRRCSMCGFVSYCSRACQVFHWKMDHMVWCTMRMRWIEGLVNAPDRN